MDIATVRLDAVRNGSRRYSLAQRSFACVRARHESIHNPQESVMFARLSAAIVEAA
jgi:hypothetical protein